MSDWKPATAEEMAAALKDAAAARRTILLGGAFSKNRMGGPLPAAEVRISTSALNSVLEYEPKDLTISVQAGMPYAELTQTLARNRQMLPLDPPLAAESTVGGVIAANLSGPRRRQYGSARDMVIGMTFATLDGELLQSGGMVVKNVAGLDVQKTMIGSMGTLAAIASVNFKLSPLPPATRTFVLSHGTLAEAIAARDRILRGVLTPAALDLVNAAAATDLGLEGYCVLLRAGGSEALLARFGRDLPPAMVLEGEAETALWTLVCDFPARRAFTVRVGHPLTALQAVMESTKDSAVGRAGSGITLLGFDSADAVKAWFSATSNTQWTRLLEWAPSEAKKDLEQWPAADLTLMGEMKQLYDPRGLLNPGRLYGRL